jgi:hypothetical protein
MSQLWSSVQTPDADSFALVELAGIVLALFALTYVYVAGGLIDIYRGDSYAIPLLHAGGSVLYVGIAGILTHRCYRRTRSRVTPVVGVLLVPTGVVVALFASATMDYRGLLFVALLAGSLWLSVADVGPKLVSYVSLLVAGVGLAVVLGGFVGTEASDGVGTPAGHVAITIGGFYRAGAFGIDLPVLWMSGRSFSHGVHVVSVLIGAIGYGVGIRRLQRPAA